MAKRFTDTGKWDKAWYRRLGCKLRDLRQYILDRCDHAGLIEIDLETFKHFIGEPISMADIHNALRGNLVVVDDKIFVPDFIEFQYKVPAEQLNPANKAHLSVIQRLKSVGVFEGHASPLQGAKDKDKELDKELDKEKEEDREPEFRGEIKSADDLRRKIPLYFRDKWSAAYPAPGWVDQEIAKCFDFHSADPATRPQTSGQWSKKLVTWLAKGWSERKPGTDDSWITTGLKTAGGR